MGILSKLFGRERRDADPSWQALIDRGAVTGSGTFVDQRAAEGIATCFACVQAISESVACLPLHVYTTDADGCAGVPTIRRYPACWTIPMATSRAWNCARR